MAALGLATALDELFERRLAQRACVDPHRDNAAALHLYERLGFLPAPWPDDHPATPDHVYLEVDAEAWRRRTAHARHTVQATETPGGESDTPG